jgi:hypothetical protein
VAIEELEEEAQVDAVSIDEQEAAEIAELKAEVEIEIASEET